MKQALPPGKICEITSPESMELLGRSFGQQLVQRRAEQAVSSALSPEALGIVVGLEGDLGAGKTTFVRGFVAGVTGYEHRVTSPTFQLMNLYRPEGNAKADGRTVAHIDAYRLAGVQAFAELGLADLLEEGVLVVVEWPDRTGHPIFSTESVYLRFTHVAESVRRVELLRVPAQLQGLRI